MARVTMVGVMYKEAVEVQIEVRYYSIGFNG